MPYRGSSNKGFVLDYWVLMALSILVVIGVAMSVSIAIPDATVHQARALAALRRYLIYLIPGFAVFFAAILFPVRWYRGAAVPFFLLTVGLLVLVLALGKSTKGAERWLQFGPFRFQPSELAKLALVWFIAWYASVHQQKLHVFWRGVFPLILAVALLVGLVGIQPNVSTAGLLLVVAVLLLFLAGVPVRLLLKIGFFGGILAVLLLGTASMVPPLQPLSKKVTNKFAHVPRRIHQFLHPEEDSQLEAVMLGLSEGGLLGAGVGRGKIKFAYLYEPGTDYVYGVVGEEMGLLGMWTVLFLYVLLGWRALSIAQRLHEKQQDPMLYLTAAGIGLVLWLFPLTHMLVVLGLAPPTGQPLPFISRGGTNLVVHMILLGLLLRLHHVAQTGRKTLR